MSKFFLNSKFSEIAVRNRVKDYLVFGLLLLLAYQVGFGLFKTILEFTLGSLARNMLPALFVGGAIVIILALKDFGFVRAFWRRPEINIKQVIFIGMAGVIFGIFLPLLSDRGLTEFMVIFVVIIAFFLSLFFMISDKGFYAVVTFLLTFPFLSLVEFWKMDIPLCFKWGPLTLTPTIAFLLILFFFSLIPQLKEDLKPSIPVSLRWAILIFLIICLLSSVLSINPLKSLQAVYLEFACPIIMFFIILRNLQEEKQIIVLAYTMVASVVLISFISVYFFGRDFGETYSAISEIKERYLVGGLHVGSWIPMVMMVLPVAIVLSVLPSSKKLKMIVWASIGFLFVSVIISFSKAAILSGIVLLLVLTIGKRSRRIIIVILLLSMIGFISFSSFVEEYVAYNFKNVSSIGDIRYMYTLTTRINAWMAALNMIKDHPLLGIGPGLWEEYIPNYGVKQVVARRSGQIIWGYIIDPHNNYIEIATYLGLLGFISWILILTTIFKNATKLMSFTKDEYRYYLTIGSIAGLSAYLTMCLVGGGFVDHAFVNIGGGIFFFALVSIIVKMRQFEDITCETLP